MKRITAAIVISAQMLGGCAEMTHLTRVRKVDGTGFILIDAKQRAIATRNGVTCAEPSPDALSALAASQNLNFATPQGTSAGQSFAIAESAASIGLRTQSIQLMRDHMYRICEAYQGGQISKFMVALLHRRFQNTMIAILAIEQLTGAMRAPAVVLGGSASSGNADAIVKLSADRDAEAKRLSTANQDLAEKKAAAEAVSADRDAKAETLKSAATADVPAAQTAFDAAKTKAEAANQDKLAAEGDVTGHKSALDALDRALTLAASTGSASSNGTIESLAYHQNMAAVADAVSTIVTSAFAKTNTPDFCTILLADAARKDTELNVKGDVVQKCIGILGNGTVMIQ